MGIKNIFTKKNNGAVKDFENAKTEAHEIYYSRYAASWLNAGGSFDSPIDINNFERWLESIGLDDDEIYRIRKIAICGKMELEVSARTFIEEL